MPAHLSLLPKMVHTKSSNDYFFKIKNGLDFTHFHAFLALLSPEILGWICQPLKKWDEIWVGEETDGFYIYEVVFDPLQTLLSDWIIILRNGTYSWLIDLNQSSALAILVTSKRPSILAEGHIIQNLIHWKRAPSFMTHVHKIKILAIDIC